MEMVATPGRTKYEVLDVPGQGCWRTSDRAGNIMRIHTKRIEIE